ncbi:MAG: DUF547 domain-containing protein [Algibacter sp.]|uniref:DUF547 domain-containing protein n=1 Tax=Algibacter sp. TaxID=1872428 RepID=UPI0026109E6D|nr:DUF547 domain-containing protein [Algibacter sp.]MDG1730157.1 DUF547 domain-containing protein [Algibacter sp.]MDG2179454.1 DUF547 domain-containing protein [Algibacter sp.]
MKYLKLITFFIFIASCSNAKRISETTLNQTLKTLKTADSIRGQKRPVPETIPEALVVSGNSKPEVLGTETENEISKSFNHDSWTDLLQKHVSSQGIVNYKRFKTDRKALLNYITSLGKNTPNGSWSKEEKLAYWINTYNAFTIDLILRYYPIKSIKDIKAPWDQRLWKLGNKWYNLNEIEHQILRKMDEPRIHFAIVCGSFSCPKSQNEAYQALNLDKQLTHVTKEFLSDSNRNEISKNSLKLSKIFQWFSKDFKQDGDLIDFLNTYSDIIISAKAKKSFKDYNWDLND